MESGGNVSWEHFLEERCELASCEQVRAVPGGSDVIDVFVFPSCVVTELCDVSPCGSDWEDVEPQSFSPKACTLWYRYAGRDEVRRLDSENASVFKKDDAAHT